MFFADFPTLLAGLLALYVTEIPSELHVKFIVQAFPPAGAIFTGIGVLLTVRIFLAAIYGTLLTPILYRRRRT